MFKQRLMRIVTQSKRLSGLLVMISALLFSASLQAQPARAKAWVWVDNPTATSSIPSPYYQFNSSGGLNRVERLATGSYRIDLPGLGTYGGMAQVAPYDGSHFCTVASWGPFGTTQQIFVRCFNSVGAPIDGKFTLLFYKEDRGRFYEDAYLWANEETTLNYTPNASYQWNSNGTSNTVRRLGAGKYEVFLPGVNIEGDFLPNGGTVQVSAYGANPRHAIVQNWYSGSTGTTVRVNTFDVAGNLVDTKFTFSFLTDVGMGIPVAENWLNMEGAFLRADQPFASGPYTPDRHYQYNNYNWRESQIERSGVGTYRIKLSGLIALNKTTALVSAYGTTRNYCSITGWSADSEGGTTADVQCRNASGQLVDGRFTFLYLTNKTVLW